MSTTAFDHCFGADGVYKLHAKGKLRARSPARRCWCLVFTSKTKSSRAEPISNSPLRESRFDFSGFFGCRKLDRSAQPVHWRAIDPDP